MARASRRLPPPLPRNSSVGRGKIMHLVVYLLKTVSITPGVPFFFTCAPCLSKDVAIGALQGTVFGRQIICLSSEASVLRTDVAIRVKIDDEWWAHCALPPFKIYGNRKKQLSLALQLYSSS